MDIPLGFLQRWNEIMNILPSSKRALFLIVVIAVVLRICSFYVALNAVGQAGLIRGDAIGYVDLAKNLGLGNGFGIFDGQTFVPQVFRTAGFPLLLAPFTLVPSGLALYSIVCSVISGIFLPILVFAVARRVISERAALLAALLAAVEPHAIVYGFLLQTEVPFMLFALGGLLAAIIAYERSSYLYAAFAGALLAYAAFIRPGYMMIFVVGALGTAAYLALKRDRRWRQMLAVCALIFITLSPVYLRMHALTGTYALSGGGWRNVYTDYLASLRSLKNGTTFSEEKNNLKDSAQEIFGISRADVNSPAYAKILRDYSLAEIWANKPTVLKLETALLVSFFIQDGYYYEFRNLGYLHEEIQPHISPTREVILHGFGAIPTLWQELLRQRFVPVFGRLFTFAILFAAIVGFFVVRSPLRYLFAITIIMSAVFATVIGLGLDARMRVPVEPLFFIFASGTFIWLWDAFTKRHANRHLHTRA